MTQAEPAGRGTEPRARARELGIHIGRFAPGRWNAITDVAGVRVGQTTLRSGEGPLVVGQGPVRTGVTVIMPRESNVGLDPVCAGSHSLNGNGEMTGLLWVEESGLLTTPIGITNTHSVGVVRDALIAYDVSHGGEHPQDWSLPVVAETYDGFLNDINGFHVKPEHVFAAIEGASSGPVAEGCVGGGTGMNCHGFKGGIGTSSRVLDAADGGWTVGVLVQANYGSRHLLRIDGVPVGREIPAAEVPTPGRALPPEAGSIIIVVATDAPLLPTGCRRLAQRATIGLARMGSIAANGSGDIFIAFSTGNRGLGERLPRGGTYTLRTVPNDAMTLLFEAVAEATEEAIVNALCAATTTTGRDHHISHAIPLDRLQAVMRRYRPAEPA